MIYLELEKKNNELKKQPFNTKRQTEYTKFRYVVTNQINNAKQKFSLHEFDNCKSNNNDKWKFVTDLKDKKTENYKINKYFVHVGTKLAAHLPESNRSFKFCLPVIHTNQSFCFEKTDTSDVIREIKKFKLKQASGYDSISARSMKEKHISLLRFSQILLNQMFEH